MDLINHVAECLAIGCDPIEVRKQLMTFGFTEAWATKYVADTVNWMRNNPLAGKSAEPPAGSSTEPTAKSSVNGSMAMGAVICITGIAVTAITFSVGFRIGGGTYIVAWGAILFGAFLFLIGAAQAGQKFEAEQRKNPKSRDKKS